MGFSRQEYWSGVPLPSPSIPGRGTKILHAAMKIEDPTCHNQDVVQPNKYFLINILKNKNVKQKESGVSLKRGCCPGASVVKNSPANAGNSGSIPGSGRSPGGGNGNTLQYNCLGNSMDRGAWWATVHGVAKSWTRLSD